MQPTNAQSPDIIASFYEAAARRQGWSDAWSALCTAFAADTGLLYRRSRPAGRPVILAARNWPHETHALSCENGLRIDPAWFGSASGEAAQRAKPRGMDAANTLCATAQLDGAAMIGMGLQRSRGTTLFTDADRQALDGVGRHVAAALRLESLLAAERIASAVRGAAMDVSPHGRIVLGANGAVLFANAAAKRIAAGQGVLLERCASGLNHLDHEEATRLETLVSSVAAGGPGGSVRISRRDGQAPIAATIEPLAADIAMQNGLPEGHYVTVTLRDLGATADAAPSHLMDLFGLTAAEAGIVPQLLCGESASLIAQSRGVAVGTVKAQASKVLAKTGAPNLRALSMMIAALGWG